MEPRKAKIVPFRPRAGAAADVGDLHFRRLVGEAGWAELPPAVRTRFSKRLGGGRTAIYTGEVVECRMSRCGRLLAGLARLIGAPLPLSRAAWHAAAVCVTEDPLSGGQHWTRIYAGPRGFPQVIHSAKRFCGPTGLEEYLGFGFGIALTTWVDKGALHFDSDHYFIRLGGLRVRLPAWLTPGSLRVSHVDCGEGSFAFVLELRHAWLGLLVLQTAFFADQNAEATG